MITSSSNAQMKKLIQLNQKTKARRQEGLFVIEGEKMFGEAPRSWIKNVYISESYAKEVDFPCEVVKDSVFRQVSDTLTPQGILAVLRTPMYRMEDLLHARSGQAPLLLVLEDLQDPGNAGTIFRTAEGAGVDGILLTKTCVDVTNPKVVRATMGSIFRMPYLVVEDVREAKELLNPWKIRLYAACLGGTMDYDEPDYNAGSAFLVGNEGKGLTDEAIGLADGKIRIPMQGRVESLNAAMACGILIYEALRQRRNIKKEG